MKVWSVRLVTASGAIAHALEEDPLDRVEHALRELGATGVTGGWEADGTALGLSFCAEAPSRAGAAVALERAHELMVRALRQAGVRSSIVAAYIEPFERQVFTQALEEARTPRKLIGATDVSKLIGVSRQRVYELLNTKHLGFPQPVARPARGALWAQSDIEAWARRWRRQPGRPKARDVLSAG